MKTMYWSLLMAAVLSMSGCASTTLVKDLALPPVTTIEGAISQLNENGFTLTDSSGAILVKAKLPKDQKLNLAAGESVKVFGNLQAGQSVFDGYVIRKQSDEQIIIHTPTPHFGFIIQSSFE